MPTTQKSETQVPTQVPHQAGADAELKAKHRTMWGLGNYASVASDVIAETGQVLVDATGIEAARPRARRRRRQRERLVPGSLRPEPGSSRPTCPRCCSTSVASQDPDGRITWEEADAEALPYDDASFDAVISCVGVMFAPHHQQAADELLRVARPGARIGLLSWTPEGFIGQMFATMKPYAPPPPPGAQPPPLWGSEDHVRELFGDRVEDVVATKRRLHVGNFASAGEFREFFKARYGPTIAIYKANAADPDKCVALDRDLDALADRYGAAGGSMEWEYLVLTARRR